MKSTIKITAIVLALTAVMATGATAGAEEISASSPVGTEYVEAGSPKKVRGSATLYKKERQREKAAAIERERREHEKEAEALGGAYIEGGYQEELYVPECPSSVPTNEANNAIPGFIDAIINFFS